MPRNHRFPDKQVRSAKVLHLPSVRAQLAGSQVSPGCQVPTGGPGLQPAARQARGRQLAQGQPGRLSAPLPLCCPNMSSAAPSTAGRG